MLFVFVSIFLSVSKAQDIVTLTPSDQLISTLDGRARLICTIISHVEVQSVQWVVNGTQLKNPNMYNATMQILSPQIETLDFHMLTSELNTTLIECRALINNSRGESRIVKSAVTSLILQGLLAAVESPVLTAVCSNIALTWTPPFTLNITLVDPDITYCVDVAVVHSSSLEMLYSECNIRKTKFMYTVLPTTDRINFTISPVNPVGNGTANEVTYFAPESRPELIEVHLGAYSVTLITSAPVQCSSMIVCVDVDTGEIITLGSNDLSTTETNITFPIQLLTENRHYNVSVTASNSRGKAVSHTRISTHDIENVMLFISGINIATSYFEHSNAAGTLFMFVFYNDDETLDPTSLVYLAIDKNTSQNYTLPFSFGSRRRLSMFVYDIESDGTLACGVSYPAVNKKIVANTHGQPIYKPKRFHFDNCNITNRHIMPSHIIIMAECVYHGSSNATGFQMIAQLSNSSEVHRLYVNKTTHLGTSASVVVEESGIYQVSILAIVGKRGIVDSNVEFTELLLMKDVLTTTTTSAIITPTPSKLLPSLLLLLQILI